MPKLRLIDIIKAAGDNVKQLVPKEFWDDHNFIDQLNAARNAAQQPALYDARSDPQMPGVGKLYDPISKTFVNDPNANVQTPATSVSVPDSLAPLAQVGPARQDNALTVSLDTTQTGGSLADLRNIDTSGIKLNPAGTPTTTPSSSAVSAALGANNPVSQMLQSVTPGQYTSVTPNVPANVMGLISQPPPKTYYTKDALDILRPTPTGDGKGNFWFQASKVTTSMGNFMSAIGNNSFLGSLGRGIWSGLTGIYQSATYSGPTNWWGAPVNKDVPAVPVDTAGNKTTPEKAVKTVTYAEYDHLQTQRSFEESKQYFQKAGDELKTQVQTGNSPLFAAAERLGWKNESAGGRNGYVGQAAAQASARQFLINQSQALATKAQQQVARINQSQNILQNAHDLTEAHNTMRQSIDLSRIAGGINGIYDPYFAYTWITEPEQENRYLNAVTDFTLQKGMDLTPFEVWAARDAFTDPDKEAAGEALFDWSNLYGDLILKPFEPLILKGLQGAGNAVKNLARSEGVAGKVVDYLGKSAVYSQATRFSNRINDVLIQIARAARNTGKVGSEQRSAFTQAFGKLGEAMSEGIPSRGFGEIMGLPIEFGTRQDREVLGMINAFATTDDLAQKGLDPAHWGGLADGAYNDVRSTAFDAEKKRLLKQAEALQEIEYQRLTTQDVLTLDQAGTQELARQNVLAKIEEDAGRYADKIADDPANLISHIAAKFNDGYLAAHKPAEPKVKNLGYYISRANQIMMSGWTKAVLSLRPAWLYRNYADNAFRAMVYGVQPFSDATLLLGRYMKDQTGRTLRELGIDPVELGATFVRSELSQSGMTIAQRMAEGEQFRSAVDFFAAARRKAIAETPEHLGPWGQIKNQWRIGVDTVSGGITDWNSAIEYSFKARMFLSTFLDNYKTLKASGARVITDRLAAQWGADSDAVKWFARAWEASGTDPDRLRQLLSASQMSDDPLVRLLNLTPTDLLDNALQPLDEASRGEFIQSVSRQIQQSMEDARLAGRTWGKADSDKLFDQLLSDFNASKAAILNHADLRAVPDLVNAGTHIGEDIGNAAAGASVPGPVDPALRPIRQQPTEAISSISRRTDGVGLASDVRDALDKRAGVVVGDTAGKPYLVSQEDGQIQLVLSRDLLDKSPDMVKHDLQSAIIDVIRVDAPDLKAEDVLRFLDDPAALSRSSKGVHDGLADLFNRDPNLRKTLAALRGEDHLKYIDLLTVNGGENATLLKKGASEDDLKRVSTSYKLQGEYQRQSMRQAKDAQNRYRLSAPNANAFLDEYTAQFDLIQSQVTDWLLNEYPAPLNKTGQPRAKAWDQYFQMRADIYESMSDALNRVVRDLESDPGSPRNFETTLSDFLKDSGFDFEFRKDGSLKKVLYRPSTGVMRVSKNGKSMPFTSANVDEFIHNMFGRKQVNGKEMRRMITELPYTRNLALDGLDMTRIGGRGREGLLKVAAARLGDEQGKGVVAYLDQMADSWAKSKGLTRADWYNRLDVGLGGVDKLDGLMQAASNRWYYLKSAKFLEDKMPARASVEQIQGMLKGKLSPAELYWSGLDDYLAAHEGVVEKADILNYLNNGEGGVDLQEKILGEPVPPKSFAEAIEGQDYKIQSEFGGRINFSMPGQYEDRVIGRMYQVGDTTEYKVLKESGGLAETASSLDEAKRMLYESAEPLSSDPTEYSGINIPGGTNYREFLFHWDPQANRQTFEGFTSAHFSGDSKNLVAHARVEDRIDEQGRKVLNVLENQSDWNQAGRKRGYGKVELPDGYQLNKVTDDLGYEAYYVTDSQGSKLGSVYTDANTAKHMAVQEIKKAGYDQEMLQVAKEIDQIRHADPTWQKYQSQVDDLLLKKDTAMRNLEDAVNRGRTDQANQFSEEWNHLWDEIAQVGKTQEAYGNTIPGVREKLDRIQELTRLRGEAESPDLPVPHNPFEKNWDSVTMKRMLRYAADNGYDVVTFPTGAIAAKIEGHQIVEGVDRLIYNETNQLLVAYKDDIAIKTFHDVPADKVKDYIGDDIAKQLLDAPAKPNTGDSVVRDILTKDVTFGGEKMRWFYDNKLINDTNAILKPWGVKVGDVKVRGVGDEMLTVHGFELTPEMKASVKEGQSLFQMGGDVINGVTKIVDDGDIIMRFAETSNVHTFIHEGVHLRLNDADPEDANILAGWLKTDFNMELPEGWHKGSDTYKEAKEKVARAFEKYAYDGQAPTPLVARVFAKMKQWMMDVYKTLSGSEIDVQFSDEVRAVFDKWMGKEQAGMPKLNTEAVNEVKKRMGVDWAALTPRDELAPVDDVVKQLANAALNISLDDTGTKKIVQEVEGKWAKPRTDTGYALEDGTRVVFDDEGVPKKLVEETREWMDPDDPGNFGREVIQVPEDLTPEEEQQVAKLLGMDKPPAKAGEALIDLTPEEQVAVDKLRMHKVNPMTPEQRDKVLEIKKLVSRRAYVRDTWAAPASRIRDVNARVLVQNEAQAMMLDALKLEGADGKPLAAADFKKALTDNVPWGKAVAKHLSDASPRQDLIHALENVVSGEGEDDLTKALRKAAASHLEKGTGTRLAQPYALKQLQYLDEETQALMDTWQQTLGRDPLKELKTLAEGRANKDALWKAFTQQKWTGDTTLAKSWGQYANTPALLRARIKDIMANLPPGASAETVEGMNMLLWQVDNFDALATNLTDYLALARDAEQSAYAMLPIAPVVRHMPEGHQTWFGAMDDAAAQVSAVEDALTKWKTHVGDHIEDAFPLPDPATAEALAKESEPAAKMMRQMIDMAAYGEEAPLANQIDEVIGATVNKKMTHKRVDGQWVALNQTELESIQRLMDNHTAYQELVGQIGQIPEGAMPRTNRYMIDYADYSRLDQMIKKVVPFWTFTSRSFPFWLETLATHPQIISFYGKFVRYSERVQYQNGLYTSDGTPMPSLSGYFKIPGTQIWVNPTAALSFRYILTPFTKTYEEDYGDAPAAQQVMMWLYDYGQLYGVSLSPWLTVPANFLGLNGNMPTNSIIPQTQLAPPWWKEEVRAVLNKIGGERSAYAYDIVAGKPVPWKDYLVERRLLANLNAMLDEIDDPNARWAEGQKVKQALLDREKNELWNATLREMDQSEWLRNLGGYVTGVYAKEFTDAEAEFQRLRDNNNFLRDQVNNKIGALIFGGDPNAEKRYELYTNKLYDTPEGYAAGLYNILRYTRTPEGEPLYGADRREYIAKQITEDEATSAYYDTLNVISGDLQKKLAAMPIGADSADRQAAFAEYFKQRDALDSNAMYALVQHSWSAGYKPATMVYAHFRNLWWDTLKATQPKWDRNNEDYTAYQQKVNQWITELPRTAQTLMTTTFKDALATSFKLEDGQAIPSNVQLTGSNKDNGRVLNVDGVIQLLLAETTPEGYDLYQKTSDSTYEALDRAWQTLYWDPYWAAMNVIDPATNKPIGGYKRDKAEQEWLAANPPPDAATLMAWVLQTYPVGQFTTPQLLSTISGRSEETVYSRTAPKTDIEAKEQKVFDILAAAGPKKDALQAEYEKLGGYWSDVSTFYDPAYRLGVETKGQSESFDNLYDRLVQAASNLGLREPDGATLQAFITAQDENAALQHELEVQLGSNYKEIMQAYWDAGKTQRTALRKNYPQIDAYYQLYDDWAKQHPTWARYYTDNNAPAVLLPETGDLAEWNTAQNLNAQLEQRWSAALGANYLDILGAYWDADSAQRKVLRKQYPQIDQYYAIQDAFAKDNPIWAKYYSTDKTTSSSSGSSSKSKTASKKSSGGGSAPRTTATKPATIAVGMGYRSGTAGGLPGNLGGAGSAGTVRLPVLPPPPRK